MYILLTTILVWSLKVNVKGDDLCPTFMQEPYNQTMLVGGEHHCPIRVGNDICYSCCVSHNSICCDDGSCMDYDPFCRYPEKCCADDYCGHQCCPNSYGVPCGPVCAPKQGYQCCNESVGFMCAKPDFCCNGEVCCTQNTHCCESNVCCGQGQQCCDDKCCLPGYHCCGTGGGHCCPDGSDCFPDGSCCPHGQACANVTNGCCASGSKCADDGNKCCMNYQFGCGNTCCDPGHVCCPHGKCCITEAGCDNDGCCPIERACGEDNCCNNGSFCCPNSPTHHCCPYGQVCCHDHCCGAETGYCGPNGECCPPGGSPCGGSCCAAGEACIRDEAHHSHDVCCIGGKYSYKTGQCCREDEFVNPDGYCCSDKSTFCSGGAQDACYTDPYSVCCRNGGVGDGTACTQQYSQCVDTRATSTSPAHKACCPSSANMVCGTMCLEQNPSYCSCCGDSGDCCYAPYTCHDDGRCIHDYSDSGPWNCWHCHKYGVGAHCCRDYHDLQPPLAGKVPGLPRAGATRDIPQLFINAIRRPPIKSSDEEKPAIKTRDTHNTRGSVQPSQKAVTLPPPPTNIIDPSSYPCFNNETIMNSTCEAWKCLEEITNCGTFGYLDRMHELYCDDFGDFGNLFKPNGQQFLVCASHCSTQEHVSLYQHGFKPCCTSLENWGNEKDRNNCMISCNFCGVYLSNIEGFKVLFDVVSPGMPPSEIYDNLCSL